MILTCPSCRTRYQADGARFVPSGKNVRCAKCGQVWFQPAPEQAPAPESDPAAAASGEPEEDTGLGDLAAADFSPADEKSAPPVDRRWPPAAQIAGWAALILMIVGIGWCAVQFRETIAKVWPESSSLYAALGMPVNVRGMALVNIAYQQDFENGQPVLSVTGKVVNISNHELPVPELRVVLSDDAEHELYRWFFDVGVSTLKAGAESAFVTRLSSPPPEARNLNISFAEPDR